MFTTTQILTWLITAGIAAIPVILWFLNKPKQVEETKSIVVEQFEKLTLAQSTEIERLNTKVQQNEIKIAEAEQRSEDCEYKHEVTELQLKHLLKQIDLNNLPKATVFILDDSKMVIIEFKKIFSDIVAIDSRFFASVSDFLLAAKIEKPPIVVLDYRLGPEMTAEDVMMDMGYLPEVFIMSQDKSIQLRIREKGMQFFYKDDHYVRKIAKAIVQHLLDKI